jgi:hypothetical protein
MYTKYENICIRGFYYYTTLRVLSSKLFVSVHAWSNILVVCQRVSLEQTVNMSDFRKSSFVEAMSTRKDSVFEKVIQELTYLENVYSIVS